MGVHLSNRRAASRPCCIPREVEGLVCVGFEDEGSEGEEAEGKTQYEENLSVAEGKRSAEGTVNTAVVTS